MILDVMIKKSLVFTLLLITAALLSAQEFACPAPPVLQEGSVFRFFTFNDGYMGFGASDEYDDLRSYGVTGEYYTARGWFLKLQLSGITQRGEPVGQSRCSERWTEPMPEPSRRDRIDLWGGYPFYRSEAGPGILEFSIGAGMTIDGRFGGMEIQNAVHFLGGVNRPFPKHYADPDFRIRFGIEGSWTTGSRYPVTLTGALAMNTLLEPSLNLGCSLENRSRDSRLWLRLEYTATADHASDSQIRYLQAFEEGLNLKVGFSGTHIFLFQNINLASREMLFDGSFTSAGGIGFTTAETHSAPPREGYLSAEGALTSSRGCQTVIFCRPGWYESLCPPLTGRTGFYGLTGNFNTHPDLDSSPGDWRIQYLAAGFRITLRPERIDYIPNLFLDAGLGLKWAQVYAIDEYASVPLREELILTGDFRLGAEQPVPLPIKGGRNRYAVQLFGWLQPCLAGENPLPEKIPWYGIGLAFVIKDGGAR